LGYTKVVAPIDGVTGMAAKSNGSLHHADSLFTTTIVTDTLYVNFSIPESDYLKVSKDRMARLLYQEKPLKMAA
jgi:hypothetical protein